MKYSRTLHSCPDMASSVMHRMKMSLPSEAQEAVVSFLLWEHTAAIHQELSDPSLQSCFSASGPQHIIGTRGYSIPGTKFGILASLNFTRFPSSLFSNLLTCFWIAAQSSGVSATNIILAIWCFLWNFYQRQTCWMQLCVSSLRLGTKMFNNTGHNRNPCCIQLVPGLELDVMLLTAILGPSRSDSFQSMLLLIYLFHTFKDWVWIDYGILSKVSHKVQINYTCCSSFIRQGHHISP